jgi:phosphoribosylformylglycinamidine cyclo-ligase
LLLSPTRTFAPVVKHLIEEQFESIHGLIHCSGGGQTKCMKYMPDNVHVVKDNLFEPPEIFQIIQECSGADDMEMYQVFNMGCRLEVYTSEKAAQSIMESSQSFGIEAQIIGRVEASDKQKLTISKGEAEIQYQL